MASPTAGPGPQLSCFLASTLPPPSHGGGVPCVTRDLSVTRARVPSHTGAMDQAPDAHREEEALTFGLRGLSRRVSVVLLVVTLVAGSAAYLADHRLRLHEQRALDACAAEAVMAAREAWSPVLAMSGYVRPVLDASSSPSLRRDMYRLVGSAAAGTVVPLDRARAGCREVHVLPLHHGLTRRRDGCVRALDAQRHFLTALSRDGATIVSTWPATLTDC